MSTKTTVSFLRDVLSASQIEGSRGRLDIFADRLVKAASEPTLSGCMEQLLRSVNASADKLTPLTSVAMVRLASSEDAPRVLRWLREQAKLVTMLAATRDESLVAEALCELELPSAGKTGAALPRQDYTIKISATCETPLAHGAEGKAGNATLFRRLAALATNGAVLELPYYSGNAVRGQLRDLMADHFLRSMGLGSSRSAPVISLWFFYAIYSGGALEEKSDAMKALTKSLGNNGAIRADGIRHFRDMLPGLSLLGCALGNRVLPGHCQFGDLRPVCAEWGTGTVPVAELMDWEYLTRREDHEDHAENHSMIASTEVLRAGTTLEGGVDVDTCIPDIEQSAIARGLQLLAARGMLGAENRRGLGRVRMVIKGTADPAFYDAWLDEHKAEILGYLKTIGALPR